MNFDLLSDVSRFAEEAVDQLRDRTGNKLDFSRSSLDIVEEVLSEAAPFSGELGDDVVRSLVERLGCYVLEVGRREFGGVYWWHESDQPVLVVGEPDFHVALTSWGKVRGRLLGDASENIPFHYSGFAERAGSAVAGTRVIFV